MLVVTKVHGRQQCFADLVEGCRAVSGDASVPCLHGSPDAREFFLGERRPRELPGRHRRRLWGIHS